MRLVADNPGISIHASLPCTPWSARQYMNIKSHGAEYLKELESKREFSRILVRNFVTVAEHALSLGGHVSFEWPSNCSGWTLPELTEFVARNELLKCSVPGCMYGVCNPQGEPYNKPWTFLTLPRTLSQAASASESAATKPMPSFRGEPTLRKRNVTPTPFATSTLRHSSTTSRHARPQPCPSCMSPSPR